MALHANRSAAPAPPPPSVVPFLGRLSPAVTRRRLAAALPHLPPGAFEPGGGVRLLDVGCGFTDLPDRVPSYVGCDRDPVLLEANRRSYPGARFVAWDFAAEDPPPELEKGSFDASLMLAVLEHLPDPARALARVAPLLRPGGTLVVTTPHPWGRLALEAGAALGLLSRHAGEEHEELLPRRDLEGAAPGAGLEVVSYRRFLAGLNQLVVYRRR